MLRVVAGTTNPTKISGIRNAFKEVFPHETIDVVPRRVENRVGPQPIGLDSIFVGALNRLLSCIKAEGQADFYVGVEAGILNVAGVWIDVHLALVTDLKLVGLGLSPAFMLPSIIVDKVITGEGTELDVVVDSLFGTRDIGSKGGVIKILTNGMVTREDLVKSAVLIALVPWISAELYKEATLNKLLNLAKNSLHNS